MNRHLIPVVAAICGLVLIPTASSGPTGAQEVLLPGPANVRADSTPGGIVLRWNAPLIDDISGYRVQRRWLDMDAREERSHTVDTGSTETSYTDSGAETGVHYAYYVRALTSDGGLSSWSVHANARALAHDSAGAAAPRSRWTVVAGELPPGVYLDPYGGSLFGVPLQVGEYSFTAERQSVEREDGTR